MNQENFFRISSQFNSSTIQAHVIEQKIKCIKLIKGDYTGIEFPLKFKQEYGSKLKDIIDTGYTSLFLISNNFKIILEENKLTGWQAFPVIVYDKKMNEIVGYHGFSITGRCRSTNFENSKIIEKQFVENGPICKYYRGISIDGWDGTDFFSPDNELSIFCTKNAAEILKKNKLTNVFIEKLSDYEVNIQDVQ